MKKAKDYLKKTKNFFSKLYTRFANYKNTKKWFVVYLVILSLCLIVLPIIKVKLATGDKNIRFLFSGELWRSTLVILFAIIGLFLWNLSISFKNWITKLCALREDEPLVDFLLLWMVVSVFIGVMDGANVGVMNEVTKSVSLIDKWAIINGLLLLGGLIWSFISLWKVSSKSNKKTKIVNIVEENHRSAESSNNRGGQVTHLFDDLNDEN